MLCAGDLTPTGDHTLPAQAAWLRQEFAPWWTAQPATEKVYVAGNHDFVFQADPEIPARLPSLYLQDQAATLMCGLTVFGLPWTPWFWDWAFNAPRDDQADIFLTEKLALAPGRTDVVVSHGPPMGFGDQTQRGPRVGSNALTKAIERLEPALVVCGHIHEDRGHWRLGRTLILNASLLDLGYHRAGNPFVVEITDGADGRPHAEFLGESEVD